MPDQVAARQLTERRLAVVTDPPALGDRLLAEPIAGVDEGLLLAVGRHRPAHADPVEGRVEEDVDERLAGGRHVGGVELLAQFGPGPRPV